MVDAKEVTHGKMAMIMMTMTIISSTSIAASFSVTSFPTTTIRNTARQGTLLGVGEFSLKKKIMIAPQTFYKNWPITITTSTCLCSTMDKSDATKPKKKKKKQKKANGDSVIKNPKKRGDKQELNDIIRGMGLTPVEQITKTKDTITTPPSRTASPKKPSSSPSSTKTSMTSTSSSSTKHLILQQKANIDLQTQLQYVRNGHACLRSFLQPPKLLSTIRNDVIQYTNRREIQAWHQKLHVAVDSATKLPNTVKECREMFDALDIPIPFLQHFNSWRFLSSVRELVTSPLLTSAAYTLLHGDDNDNVINNDGVSSPSKKRRRKQHQRRKSVRLYQDSIFIKRINDNETPWHIDAKMAPFDTSHMVTFWIPLQNIPSEEEGGSGLCFVDQSHVDIALPYWNGADGDEYTRLDERYGGDDGVKSYMPLNVGDITAHSGWTLHYAPPGGGMVGDEVRYAIAVTYVDGRAEIRDDVASSSSYGGEKGDDEDNWSYKDWIHDVKPRTQFSHDLVPIIYPIEKME
mmetsp:Transcript_25623/g.37564  ORF Transcript_25623/g.37564 Transcript_25623/m.37564 type:complete len:518 (+) Transcript_25623:435-1988(+)